MFLTRQYKAPICFKESKKHEKIHFYTNCLKIGLTAVQNVTYDITTFTIKYQMIRLKGYFIHPCNIWTFFAINKHR